MTPEDENGTDCERALSNLVLFIDHEMDDATWDEIRLHVEGCAPCLSEFDLEYLVKQLVARSCHERAPEPLRERVLMSIRTVQVQISEER